MTIQDEFTHRSDLTGQQRYYLRHREFVRERVRKWQSEHLDYHRNYQERWRCENAEKWEQIVARHRKKLAIKKIAARNNRISKFLIEGKSRLSKMKRDEILRLHAKGKDISTIVIYTSIPCSIVSKIINKHVQETQPMPSLP